MGSKWIENVPKDSIGSLIHPLPPLTNEVMIKFAFIRALGNRVICRLLLSSSVFSNFLRKTAGTLPHDQFLLKLRCDFPTHASFPAQFVVNCKAKLRNLCPFCRHKWNLTVQWLLQPNPFLVFCTNKLCNFYRWQNHTFLCCKKTKSMELR